MISELITSVNLDIDALSMTLEKADIVMSYTYNQYLIESASNELRAITEEVSLDHPEGEATEGLIGKASRIIKKVIAALIAAVKNIYGKIRTAIEDAKFNVAMKKAEKAAKENAKIKNTTVKVHNPAGELKVIKQYKDFLNKVQAKAKAGKTDGIINDIGRESEEYDKKLSAAKLAAVATVTVAAAIGMLKVHSNKVSPKAADNLVNDAKVDDKFEGKKPEFINAMVKIQNEMAKAAKDEASAISKAVTSAMSAVRDGIVGSTEIKTNDTSAKETIKDAMESETVDIDYIVDSIINEAEENISGNDTRNLVDTFESTVSEVMDNENFDPELFLALYEASIDDNTIEDSEDEVIDDDITFESESVAEFIVNNLLND